MSFKLSNVWKDWVSTIIGAFVPVLTGLITTITAGQINWTAVKMSFAGAAILAFTDILKKISTSLSTPDTTTDSKNGPTN